MATHFNPNINIYILLTVLKNSICFMYRHLYKLLLKGSQVIVFCILMPYIIDELMIWLGEVTMWSLLGCKGLFRLHRQDFIEFAA